MRYFLVPIDFTDATDKALEHAVKTADILKVRAKVLLLHMCKSDEKAEIAKEELIEKITAFKTRILMVPVVRKGTFRDIPEVAKELGTDLIFLGTHGAQGIQKILGSHALKLVSNSNVPYIIVQKDAPRPNGYQKILCTISYYPESVQKIQLVSVMAGIFGSSICFIYQGSADEGIKNKINANLQVMKKILDKKGISYEIKASTGKNFNDDTIELAAKIKADMIAIMNMQKKNTIAAGLLGPNYEQELIMNSRFIPIMMLNPEMVHLMGKKVV